MAWREVNLPNLKRKVRVHSDMTRMRMSESQVQNWEENLSERVEKFFENSLSVHGDRYDYSKVEYVNAITKVTIICPDHGEFQQTPSNHKGGKGCPECARFSRPKVSKKTRQRLRESQPNRLTVDEVIHRFEKSHGKRYDYSKVEYVNNHTKVTIICSEHGEFLQKPVHHRRGQGCPECARSRQRKT